MNTSIKHILTGIKELEQNLGVVSTSNDKPEAAVVYFSYDEHLNIYFTTRKESRKYKNLIENPYAAFVIYNQQLLKTIQIEGVVSIVENPHEQNVHFSKLIELAVKNNPTPPIDQIDQSEIMFMKIETTWARLGNFEINRTGNIFEEVTF